MQLFPHPTTSASGAKAPFAPFYLFLGITMIVLATQGLIVLQGFFIALAQLDKQQTLLMLRPICIYVIPAYYFVGKWLGCVLPDKAFMLSVLVAVSSFSLVSLINLLWLKLPFAHSLADLYILLTYIAVSIMGGMRGKKKSQKTF